jgi:hypothetical protein
MGDIMAKKTIKEMIEVMKWFEGEGEVEYKEKGYDDWDIVKNPIWDWYTFDYRIKESKQKITIEKWLIALDDIKVVIEASDIDAWLKPFPTAQKIKLIESYEVEI